MALAWRTLATFRRGTAPVAAVSSAEPPQTQPLTPRQRRLAQQRKKWEETQRQQRPQPDHQPKQQAKHPQQQATAAPQPCTPSAAPGKGPGAADRPSASGGDHSQTPAAAPHKPQRRSDQPGPTFPAGPSTTVISAVSAGARRRSRGTGADAPGAAATAPAAPMRARGDAAEPSFSGRAAAADGDTLASRRRHPPPQHQTDARLQQQQAQQQERQQERQEDGWPSLFARAGSGATLPPSPDLRALPGPQLAALARQWSDELVDHWQRDQAAASRASQAPADAAAAAASSAASVTAQLPAAASARLAALTAAVEGLVTHGSVGHQDLADLVWCVGHYDRDHALRALHPAMRVPFSVVPQFMPGLQLEDFMSEVELRRDTIYLDDGSRAVEESRLTGWQSDIGATFKYSGKEMQPQPGGLSPNMRKVRDALTALTGIEYDSVLVNYYADGKCGMRYHVDPLYDRWTPNSAVVSLGDTRTFIFREITDHNTRWQYRVRNGDVVLMYGDCQDRLQHCVRVEKRAEDAGPRMSLVFKERLRGPTGQFLLP